MRAHLALVLSMSALVFACATKPDNPGPAADSVDEEARPSTSWNRRRARPAVVRGGPSPAAVPALALTDGMERARYPSEGRALLAVIARPPSLPRTADTPVEKLPGVVLVHGGAALTQDTLAWAEPFVAAGFIVMLPSLRGENGNPGSHELLRGELDDLKAAARFFAQEPDVDVDRLYAFGHSAGGGLVSLLALKDDQPFRKIATSNGVYAAATFLRWRAEDPRKVPFDTADLDERTVRALAPNAHELVRPLVIYAGDKDPWTLRHAALVKERKPELVEVITVKGDHMGSLPDALGRFLALIAADAFSARAGPRPVPRE